MWDWIRKLVRDVRMGMLSDEEYRALSREAMEANTEIFQVPGGRPIKITHLFSTFEARYYELDAYKEAHDDP